MAATHLRVSCHERSIECANPQLPPLRQSGRLWVRILLPQLPEDYMDPDCSRGPFFVLDAIPKVAVSPTALPPLELDRLKLEFSAALFWLGEDLRTMKASKFSDAQKAFVLKQGEEGTPVAEIWRKAGISPATYFSWKKKYAGLLPDEMRRLKALEDEAWLKKIVADLTLDREMLQDVIRRNI